MTEDELRDWRRHSLQAQNNFYGSTGLLRLSEAGSGAPGTFRVRMMTEWFTQTGFLCTSDRPCAGKTDDKASHFGAVASLSITATKYLEAFASIRSYANSNDMGSPKLLQVLGDTTFGLKAFTPYQRGRVFNFGGEAQLLLVNGTGGVGLDGKGTGARFRALATADFTESAKRTPLRVHANLGYRVDNTGQLVSDFEDSRKSSVTRIQRFGLGINRVDFVEAGLGLEGMFPIARPFIAYNIDVPTNRQQYSCNPEGPTNASYGDRCLGNEKGLSTMPSRLTIGARTYPILHGFAPMAALDIGITGTSNFVEEIAPQPKWTLYFGLGYAVDVIEPKPVIKHETVERVVPASTIPTYVVRGSVHEQGKSDAIANAVVHVQGRTAGYTTGIDGKFETGNIVDPGTYTFTIKADGYKDGICTATVTQAPPAAPAAAGLPPAPPPPPAALPPAPAGASYVEIDCPLEAAPRLGNIVGKVTDDKQAPVANASVLLVDAEKKEHRINTDGTGSFKFAGLGAGLVEIKVDAEKFMRQTASFTVVARQDVQANITMIARPKTPSVIVNAREITIRRQIQFETDSSVIKGESNSLMAEIADVLSTHPEIKRVEIQGHTDNAGAADHNQALSETRARAVRDWLTAHGVESSRLDAKGYGQSRPLVPNVTAGNRARNRRVQFAILDRDAAVPAAKAAPKVAPKK